MVPAGEPTALQTVAELGRRCLGAGDLVDRRRQLAIHRRRRCNARTAGRRRGSAYLGLRRRPAASGGWTTATGLMVGGDAARSTGHADLRRAATRGPARRGLRARRRGRRRTLRQDGAQRHRVRADAGATPRATSCSRQGTSSSDVHGCVQGLDPGHRGPLLAARPAGQGLEADPGLAQIRWLRSTTRARAAGPSQEAHQQRGADAGHLRLRCSPGSSLGQDDCPAMKAVSALRSQFGGHATRGGRGARAGLLGAGSTQNDALTACTSLTCADRLPQLLRGRAALILEGHRPGRAQRPGQDQPGRGDRVRRHPRVQHRVPPTPRWSGSAPPARVVRVRRWSDGRPSRWSRSRSPRARPTGPG